MLTVSHTKQNLKPIALSVVGTLSIWLGSKWYFQDWFTDPFKYPAKAASLSSLILMCWCILLSTRWRVFEDFFGGLDKVYQVHKRLGRWSFWIILLHPLCLAADQWPDIQKVFLDMWFRVPVGDPYLIGQNVGVASFLIMAILIVFTLSLRFPYHVWKRTHEWFGLVLLLSIIHIIYVDADIARYPLLGAWIYGLLSLTAIAFVYIRFMYRFLGPRHRFVLETLERHGDVLKITFAPRDREMDFRPSQFVYLVVHKPGISPEPHPYSIACGYNLEGKFKLGIKLVGDHTRSLRALEKGDTVSVFGPYGRFSQKFLEAKRDCVLIGGGVGITPFIGMWHVALYSEERVDKDTVSETLQGLHPEIVRTWKSPRVSLFYICHTKDQASFDEDIRGEVLRSHFHGFEALETRGHHYELYLSSEKGLFSAQYANDRVPGGIANKHIFLCGPSPMVEALIRQLLALGVPERQIIIEDFNLF
jgi:predicted ferric reductase